MTQSVAETEAAGLVDATFAEVFAAIRSWRDGIESAFSPRVTAKNTPYSARNSLDYAEFFDALQHIRRTTGRIRAHIRQGGGNAFFVEQNQTPEQPLECDDVDYYLFFSLLFFHRMKEVRFFSKARTFLLLRRHNSVRRHCFLRQK